MYHRGMCAEFNPLDWQLLYRFPERMHKKSSWTEHVPFAMALVEMLHPRVIVELGTQHGVSYCAFCQAVAELKLPTRCYAVDTWLGDVHANYYKESVFLDLQRFHRRYESFSVLYRMTFDQALSNFPDDSVDLLHIDGLHTYEAVKTDFETWRRKLSDRAVVLFHDTVEAQRDFGVYRLWAELSPNFPSFNFEHGHGLGILAVGAQQPSGFLDFLHTANAKPAATRALFASLGRRVLLETEKRWLNQKSPVQRALTVLKSKSLLR
ncbi:MAG TPA: class I SAM-dependent methyltransferase [Candidatus Acidoferrum sp.]|nr:class I SAM-dependent methyltransferase [Candidatus Acidoferrum sp.]